MISVVIPTRNRRTDLVTCLQRIAPSDPLNASIDYEVIVTDDGDDSLESFLAAEFPWVRYNRGPRTGPAANRNSGAKAASSEWIVFTDDDCLPEPGWLQAYDKLIRTRNDIAVLEGKTIAVGPRTRADMECPANLHGGFLWSCNMAIKKAIFFDMMGFDENYPCPAMEDVDFHWRLKLSNTPVCFAEEAVVGHPWRVRKGFKHIWKIAEATHYYVKKFPEKKKEFSSLAVFKIGLRRLCIDGIDNLCSGRWRGLFREAAMVSFASIITILKVSLR